MFAASSLSILKFKLTMNKRTLLRGKAMTCLMLTCLLLVLSCRKENLIPNSNILEKGLSIQEAKMYFEKNFQKSLKSKTLLSSGAVNGLNGQDVLAGKQPMWDASVLKNLSLNTNAVLTPIHKEGLYVHISGKKMVKFGFLNYMMMYRNSKDSIITEWVELKPTEKWIESKFSRNYEGRILVKDWDGKLKRIINYKGAKTDKSSNSLSSKKLAVNGALMTGNNVTSVCFETTIYTVTTYSPRTLCGCQPAHTFEEWAAGQCICSVDKIPRKGYTTTIDVETNQDCYEIEEDGGIKGGAPGPVGGGTYPTSPGGNGSTNPGDYTPIHCNPDPNYTVPTTPPPPGQDYAIPCSELAIPDDDIPDPNDPVAPLTTTELLIHYFNADPNIDMHLTAGEVAFLNGNAGIVEELRTYLLVENQQTKESGRWAVAYLNENRGISFEAFRNQFLGTSLLGADPDADNWTDPDNTVLTDPDQTVYQQYQDNQLWPTVDRKEVMPFEKFVPFRKRYSDPTKDENCLVLSKEQLAMAGYACSGYLPGSQTFQIYTASNGVNSANTKKAITYLIEALNNKIPVLVGVDNRPGTPSTANLDGCTDHFVVIVGMGTDDKGKFFQFVDSSTPNISDGASYSNRLYYNATTGKISGKTANERYRNMPGMHDYIITQVRKSIKK